MFDLEKIQNLLYFVTPEGRPEVIARIHEMKRVYGAKWLAEFKRTTPDFVFIVDLVANHDAETSFLKLQEYFKQQLQSLSYFQRIAAEAVLSRLMTDYKGDLFQLHADLKAEIDKPRT